MSLDALDYRPTLARAVQPESSCRHPHGGQCSARPALASDARHPRLAAPVHGESELASDREAPRGGLGSQLRSPAGDRGICCARLVRIFSWRIASTLINAFSFTRFVFLQIIRKLEPILQELVENLKSSSKIPRDFFVQKINLFF